MSSLRLSPFTGHVVAAAGAHAVVAPPYDALSADARAAMAAADPRSFLNVLPPGPEADVDLEHTLRACRRSLDRLLTDGHFRAIDRPALAVVAFGTGAERVTAVVGDLPAAAFEPTGDGGEVLPHERVDPVRVHHLVRYLEVVGIASSPVALTHRRHQAVERATAAVTVDEPAVAFRDDNGVDVALWLITDPEQQDALAGAIATAGRLFVADGHHRGAAVAAHDPVHGRVLSALLPADRLQVLAFHRRVDGVSSSVDVLAALRQRGLGPEPLPRAATPTEAGVVHIAVAGRWWRLDLRDRVLDDDPVEALDVRLAEREVIAPILAAQARDGGTTPRVRAVASPLGLAALEGPDAVGIVLTAPHIEDVLRVAEAGLVMPPKTTYVLPKLRSGLLVVPR
ncbi:MAG: DUF1015 family protein [Actinobacteria bacterium]|jgi:uncharacterized protein (DUF1015 family)|nr:DUF1015 family protein [Actinomycetota bacterium]